MNEFEKISGQFQFRGLRQFGLEILNAVGKFCINSFISAAGESSTLSRETNNLRPVFFCMDGLLYYASRCIKHPHRRSSSGFQFLFWHARAFSIALVRKKPVSLATGSLGSTPSLEVSAQKDRFTLPCDRRSAADSIRT